MIATRLTYRLKPYASNVVRRHSSNKSDLLKKANIALSRQNGRPQQDPTNAIKQDETALKSDDFTLQEPVVKGIPSATAAVSSSVLDNRTSSNANEAPKLGDVHPSHSREMTKTKPASSFDQYRHPSEKHMPQTNRQSMTAIEPNTSFSRTQFHQGHLHEFAPRIVVVGVGGGGGNAVNNMIANQLRGE